MDNEKRKAQIKRQNEAAKKKRATQPLTNTELEIIKLIYQEKTSAEIAKIFGKSVRTIENHRIYIVKKIGCKNVVGVVKYAIKKKIV